MLPLTGISTSMCGVPILHTFAFSFLLQLHTATCTTCIIVCIDSLSTVSRMVGIIRLTVLGRGFTILNLAIDLRRNIEKAKSTGLPYIVGRKLNLSSFHKKFEQK